MIATATFGAIKRFFTPNRSTSSFESYYGEAFSTYLVVGREQ